MDLTSQGDRWLTPTVRIQVTEKSSGQCSSGACFASLPKLVRNIFLIKNKKNPKKQNIFQYKKIKTACRRAKH